MRCVLLLVMTSALSLAYAGEVPPSTGAPIAPATAPTGKAPSAQAPKPGEAPKPATTGEPTPPVPGAKDDGKGGPVDPTRGSPGPGGDAGGVGTKPGSHGMVVRLDTGGKLAFRAGQILFANFGGEWSSRTQSYTATGGFRTAW